MGPRLAQGGMGVSRFRWCSRRLLDRPSGENCLQLFPVVAAEALLVATPQLDLVGAASHLASRQALAVRIFRTILAGRGNTLYIIWAQLRVLSWTSLSLKTPRSGEEGITAGAAIVKRMNRKARRRTVSSSPRMA